ncbi:MAG: hypothetical protein ACKOEC_08285, partial [Acidimicrobiia bacterium]
STANVYQARPTQLDGRVSGSLFDLPAGPLGAAVGVDFRTEEMHGEPDLNSYNTGPTAQRWQGAAFFDPIRRQRSIDGAFAEVRVPVTREGMNIPMFRLV